MRLSRFISLLSICMFLLLSARVNATNLNISNYDIYYGDVDGDGRTDIYFHGKDQFILIHGDVSVPLVIQPTSFVSYSVNPFARELMVVDRIDETLLASNYSALNPDIDLYRGDFNGDSVEDFWVLNEEGSYQGGFILDGAGSAINPESIFDLSTAPLNGMSDPRTSNVLILDINDDNIDDIVFVESDSNIADTVFTLDLNNQTLVKKSLVEPFASPVTLVGASEGSLTIGESGAANFSMVIATPAGTAGVTPELSINYSSQGQNGLMGLGWNISGLSAIVRCRQTLNQDNNPKSISWDNEDRFCLDGQRLMLVSGNYGEPNSVYKTEIESFTNVTALGGTPGNPGYFRITKKDGSTSYYGFDQNAKEIAHNGKTFTWARDTFEDNVGNSILYIYSTDLQNGFRIEEIRYAFGPSRNDYAAGKASVLFEYEDRLDVIKGFVAGYEIGISKRLSKINVINNGQVVRNYNLRYLKYDPLVVDFDKLSRLAHIQECVINECLAPSEFSWSILPFKPNFLPSVSSFSLDPTGNSSDYRGPKQFGDVNGDGKLDIVIERIQIGSEHIYHNLEYRLSSNNGTELTDNPVNASTWSISLGEDKLGSDKSPFKWSVVDYNNDGRTDVITYHQENDFFNVYLSKFDPIANDWRLTETPIVVGQGISTEENHTFVDINGDGLLDAVSPTAYWLLERDPSQSNNSETPYHFGVKQTLTWQNIIEPIDSSCSDGPNAGEPASYKVYRSYSDFNADGVTDVIGTEVSVMLKDKWRLPGCLIDFERHTSYVLIRDEDDLVNYYQIQSPEGVQVSENNFIQTPDLNGDYLPDLFFQAGSSYYYQINNGSGFEPAQVFPSLGSSPREFQFVDFSGDGRTDVAYKSGNGDYMVTTWTGEQFGIHNRYFYGVTNQNEEYSLIDISNDGRVDLLHFSGIFGDVRPSERQAEANNVITTFVDGFGRESLLEYQAINHSGHYKQVGQTCDPGAICSGAVNEQALRSTLLQPNSLPLNSQAFGLTSPVIEFLGPLYVTTKLSGSMPTGNLTIPGSIDQNAINSIEYFYGEAFAQAGGRGFLGFKELIRLDTQTGIKTVDEYRVDFPFTGYPLRTKVLSSDGSLLKEAENIWELQNWNPTWQNQVETQGTQAISPIQPFLASSTERSYPTTTDLNTTNKFVVGASIQSEMTVHNQYDDFGNATSIIDSVTSGGDTFSTTTSNQYGSSIFEKEMGRLSRTEVTHSRTVSGVTKSTTRTSAFVYYQNGNAAECNAGTNQIAGMLCQEIVEPDDPEFKVTTTHFYNSMGNPTRIEQAALGEQTRVTRTEYDTDGRYIEKSYDGFNHILQEIVSRNTLGMPTQVNLLNGLVKYSNYDVLGRVLSESNNTGQYKETRLLSCATIGCPVGAVQAIETALAGGGKAIVFVDSLRRSIREGKIGFDGRWSYSDTEYDFKGRTLRKSETFYGGTSPQFWAQSEYDGLGRVLKVVLPDGSQSLSSFDGFSATVVNNLGQSKSDLKNAKGELIEVTDNLGTKIKYEYDAQSNLIFVRTGNRSDLTISLTYDLLSRKKSMDDPDKGNWQYTYTKFGELKTQTDAKGQTVTNNYDALGRMIDRIDRKSNNSIENYTRWYYDGIDDEGSAVPNAVGQLTAVIQSSNTNHKTCSNSSTEYCERYGYDNLGRSLSTNVYLGSSGSLGSYKTRVVYDSIGRVESQYDVLGGILEAQSNSVQTSGVVNSYNFYGYLQNSTDIATGDLLYQLESTDVRGNITAERLANQAVTNYGYNLQTGLLETQTANLSSIFAIQNINYDWDTIGNLISRRNQSTNPWTNQNQDRQESFCYDSLNRLIKTRKNTLNPSCASLSISEQDLQYDNLGNITYKQNVGNYSYSQNNTGPHAVTSTSDGATYAYDVNGSMASDSSGRNLLYTTFDKPYQITKGSHQIDFKYGPDRARYQRIDTNTNSGEVTTTQYLGGIERVSKSTSPNEVEWKRYLPGGAIYTVTTSVANEIHAIQSTDKTVLYKDHLGSTDVITDIAGNVLHAMSFDPWGERRDGWTWNQLTVNELVNYRSTLIIELGAASETTKGFTGHEMLDEVGLIHMNGRIYDPRLARFVQADPFIQATSDSQLFNRYSYTRNNPLNATDPSGYFLSLLSHAAGAYIGSRIDIYISRPIFKVLAKNQGLAQIVQVFGSYVSAYYCGPCSIGFNAQYSKNLAYARSGSLNDAYRAAAIAGATSAAFYGIGAANWDPATTVLAHGLVGGTLSELQGGDFGSGFLAGFISGFAAESGLSNSSTVIGAIVGIVVGGTTSVLTGGKFANGAVSAAFSLTVAHGIKVGFRTIRTLMARNFWPSHYARMEINALNVNLIGLGATGLTDDVLREAGMERSGYEWKMFHDKGSGRKGQQRWTMSSGEYAGTEMVVDTNGNLILDQPINSASYNYGETGFGHTVKDVLPYILFGNSSNDPSNIFQRIGRFGEIPRRKLFESSSAYGQ